MPQFTIRSGRTIVAATIFGALLSTVPLHDGRAAEQAAQPAQLMTAPAKHTAHGWRATITVAGQRQLG